MMMFFYLINNIVLSSDKACIEVVAQSDKACKAVKGQCGCTNNSNST